MKRAYSGLLRSKLGLLNSALFKVAGGTGLGQLITVVAMPVITRFYSPYEFGQLGLFTSVMLILASFGALKLDLTIPIKKSYVEFVRVFSTCIAISVIGFLSLTLVSLILLVFFYEHVHFNKLLVILSPIGFLAVSVFSVCYQIAIRYKEYNVISKVKVYQSLTGAFIQILSGVLNIGLFGLLAGYLASQVAGVNRFLKGRRFLSFLYTFRRDWMEQTIRDNLSFIRYTLPATILNASLVQFPVIILSFFFSMKEVGYFIVAQKIIGIPINLLGKSTSDVFSAELADRLKSGVNFRLYFFNLLKKQVVVSMPLVVVGSIGLGLMLEYILGPQWKDAGAVLMILSIMNALKLPAIGTGNILFLLQNNKIHLFREILRMFLLLLSIPSIMYFKMDFLLSVAVLSVLGLIGYCVYIYLSCRVVVRYRYE